MAGGKRKPILYYSTCTLLKYFGKKGTCIWDGIKSKSG